MRRLLKICDSFGTEFLVAFNASKSACVVVSKRKYCFDGGLQFTIGGSQISVSQVHKKLTKKRRWRALHAAVPAAAVTDEEDAARDDAVTVLALHTGIC